MAAPVVLRIKLRYDDVEALVQKFAPNVGKAGLFLPTKSVQPVGTEIKFELRLSNDTPVLVGMGRVKAAREPDPANPKAAFGIAIELMRVTREGREVILKMLERRRQLGLPDVNLPLPEDVDAARRAEVEQTSVRDTNISERGMPRVDPPVPTPGDSLLTSPRRPSGGIGAVGVAKREPGGPRIAPVVAPLPPEPARRQRPRVSEVIARAQEASGALAAAITVPGLDEEVDVARALARARVLAAGAGDLDAELAALRDSAAAPLVEISVEAASAELARQLGGAPVRRDRSAGWAPPPAVVEAIVGPVSMPVQAIEVDLESAPVHVTPPASEAPPPVPVEAAAAAEAEAEAEIAADALVESEAPAVEVPAGALIYDDADPAKLMRAVSSPIPLVAPSHLAELEDSGDEHTQIGALPIAPEAYETQPALPDAEALAERLEAQLAEAEAEDPAAGLADEGFGAPAAPADDGFAPPSEDAEYETAPVDDGVAAAFAAPAEAAEVPIGDEDIEEIDDFEILAEADADDADLLLADGEADASGAHVLPPAPLPGSDADDALTDDDVDAPPSAHTVIAPFPPGDDAAPMRPSVRLPGITPAPGVRISERQATVGPSSDFDFSALDLGEDSRADVRRAPPGPRMTSEDVDMAELDESLHGHSAGYPLGSYPVVPESAEDAGFDRPISEPVAESFDQEFDEVSAFGKPAYPSRVARVEAIPPAPVHRAPRAPRAGLDLESALDALDGLEDDEEVPVQRTPHAPHGSGAPRAASRGRSEGDGGVLIDFDDDE